MTLDHDPSMEELTLDGVLLGTLARWDANQPFRRWSIATGEGLVTVIFTAPDLLYTLLSESLRPCRFRVLRWPDQDPATPSLVSGHAWRLDDRRAIDCLPADTCPVPGVLDRARSLLDAIAAEPLRRFVHDVLDERDVHSHFWTMPASARHHHARPGGLAQHSVEVAEDMASHGQLTATERDLGIVGGFLHDIGKVWSYTNDMFPSDEGLAMGHELTGLCRLEPHLRRLEQLWPHGAWAMRVLLSGCGRPRAEGSMPMALLARVRACDQRSCERNGGSTQRPGRSWVPEPFRVAF